MRWYEKLYLGEKAQKKRLSVIRAVRKEKTVGYYVLTLASNGQDLLDIYPAFAFTQPYYKEKDLLIIGIAADFKDAAMLSGKIVSEVYQKTGGFDIAGFLQQESGQDA